MGIFSKLFNKGYNKVVRDTLVSKYEQFISSPEEYDFDPADANLGFFDSNYVLPTLVEFLQNNAQIVNGGEGNALMGNEFIFNGTLYHSFFFHRYPSTVTFFVDKPLKIAGGLNKASILYNNVNKIDPIHQIGLTTLDDKKELCVRVFRQVIITPSIGNADTIKRCLLELNDYAEMLSRGEVPNPNDWKKYAIKPVPGVACADDLWFPSNKDNTLASFGLRSNIICDDAEKTVHEMIYISNEKNHAVNALGREIFLDTDFIEDYNITTYKDFPYLVTLNATIYPENYTSKLLLKSNQMIDFATNWNQLCHFGISKICCNVPSHWDVIQEYSYKITTTGLFAGQINMFTYYHLIGSMEKAIACAIARHG